MASQIEIELIEVRQHKENKSDCNGDGGGELLGRVERS